jgi:geranyl-CoA carboxylase beta subunit
MPVFESALDTASAAYAENRASMLALIERHDALRDRSAAASSRAGPRFARRGQLLPRERLALLLDAGAPWLELAACAGYLLDVPDPA